MIGIYKIITIKSMIEFMNDDIYLYVLDDESLNKICKAAIKHNININTKKNIRLLNILYNPKIS